MDNINILICTDGIFPFAVGGMQRHSRRLAESLAQIPSLSITVVHPHKEQVFDPSSGISEISIEGIDPKKNYLKECYAYSKRMDQVIQQYPDHLIYSQGLSVWHNIENTGSRVVVNPHGLEPFQAIGFKDKLIAIPFKRVFRFIFNHAAHVVSLGGDLTEILARQIKRSKIVELANGVDIPETKTKSYNHDTFEFFMVSRFAGNKGIPVYMKALEQLSAADSRFEKWKFILAGKGPLYDQVKNSNRLSNVELPGFITDEQLFAYYDHADCFVLPTLFEGMPTVILEAMARSVPIIATNTGAISALVDDSNGFLIPKNNINALAKAIQQFADLSAEQKSILSVNSKRKSLAFEWTKIAEAHASFFRKIKSI